MSSPVAGWGSYFNKEWRVNGLWNALLSTHYVPEFAGKSFHTCPEALPGYTNTQGLKADLAFRAMTLEPDTDKWQVSDPCVAFEDKGGDHKTTSWDDILDRSVKWCDEGGSGRKFHLWAIAAWGSKVTFYHHNETENKMVAISWKNNKTVWGKKKTFDLTVNNDWIAI